MNENLEDICQKVQAVTRRSAVWNAKLAKGEVYLDSRTPVPGTDVSNTSSEAEKLGDASTSDPPEKSEQHVAWEATMDRWSQAARKTPEGEPEITTSEDTT